MFQGIVTKVSAKPWEQRGKMITLYSFQLAGQQGWFRTGTTPVPAPEGSTVQFEVSGNNNVELATFVVLAPPGAQGAPAQQAPAPQYGALPPAAQNRGNAGMGQNREGYWAEKEQRDIAREERYQAVDVPRMSFSASQDRAVNLVAAALAADALSFGTAAKGKRLDMLLSYVDEVTAKFFAQSMDAHNFKPEETIPAAAYAEEEVE